LGDTTGAPLLYVPAGYRPNRPAGVLLLLHGATSVGLAILAQLVPFADAANLILLAPNARLRTWDRIHGIAGPDVGTIDHALEHVFTRYAVDSRRLAVAGFSDGASFALSLGLTNGDLFADVIALSPGFLPAGTFHGHPRVFISHGTQDEVLPIRCSQRIVELLRASGYDVTYAEFAGPHVVPPDLARAAVTWISSAAGLTARH
jgi:predicted esterase